MGLVRFPGGPLEHVAFLHKTADDPRKNLIYSLKNCIGEKGDIIVFNQSFEKGRLKELGDAYQEYATSCESMILRLVDLQVPFSKFQYLHPKQNGSASLKKVLPALVGYGYENLTISEGGLASTEYSRVTYSENISIEERARVYADLEVYCALDTKAMVDILKNLSELIT